MSETIPYTRLVRSLGVMGTRISERALREQADANGLHIIELALPGTLCGLYDHDRRVIFLHDKLSKRQRRCTLTHELIHAHYGDRGRALPGGETAEQRTQTLTALTLITPADYRRASRECEQCLDPSPQHVEAAVKLKMRPRRFMLTLQLHVTKQVLTRYERIMHTTLRATDPRAQARCLNESATPLSGL